MKINIYQWNGYMKISDLMDDIEKRDDIENGRLALIKNNDLVT